MSGIIAANYPNLYDQVTGKQIGYIGLDNKEYLSVYPTGGFIPTIFTDTFTVKQVVTLGTIAKYITKLKVFNSSNNPVWFSFSTDPAKVGDSLRDLSSAGAIKIDAGDTNVFSVGDSVIFGLYSDTGSNSVKVVQGV